MRAFAPAFGSPSWRSSPASVARGAVRAIGWDQAPAALAAGPLVLGPQLRRLHRSNPGRRSVRISGYGAAGRAGLVDERHADVRAPQSRATRRWGALAGGVLAASSVLFLRVAVAVAILHAPLLKDLAPLLAGPFLVGIAAVLVNVRRLDAAGDSVAAPANPLQLGAALQMTLLFQFVLVVLHAAERWFGQTGISTSAMLLGLTDVDALTASISNRVAEGMSQGLGAVALAIGITANTCMKCALTLPIGQGAFRVRAASGLGAMILAGVVSIILLTR
jgi:hypothetical protein